MIIRLHGYNCVNLRTLSFSNMAHLSSIQLSELIQLVSTNQPWRSQIGGSTFWFVHSLTLINFPQADKAIYKFYLAF